MGTVRVILWPVAAVGEWVGYLIGELITRMIGLDDGDDDNEVGRIPEGVIHFIRFAFAVVFFAFLYGIFAMEPKRTLFIILAAGTYLLVLLPETASWKLV